MKSKEERPPITEEYLEQQGPPTVINPALGIISIVSGDGCDTVDMLPEHAEWVAERLLLWAKRVRGDFA